MKFKILIIFLFICSCASNSTKLSNKAPFTSMGFAYIFNYDDYESKIIEGKLDNSQLQVAHNSLRANTLIKIINPQTKDYLVLKNKNNMTDRFNKENFKIFICYYLSNVRLIDNY